MIIIMNARKKRIYLDYAASTPVDPSVFAAMRPYFSERFGNPGSVHSFGQEAIAAVDASREKIAHVIGAEFRDIIFTGSATEANNLALRGVVNAMRKMREASALFEKDRECRPDVFSDDYRAKVILLSVEHESILETAREFEKEGVEVIYLPVDKNGMIDLRALRASLDDRTILVSVMYANNEIGTVQPIFEIRKIIDDFKKERYAAAAHFFPLFHTDAVQAFQFLDCDAAKLGVDMMTLSAHKIYGPKGTGCLYTKKNTEYRIQNIEKGKAGTRDSKGKQNNTPLNSEFSILNSIITGGGQEFGLRSGTENVPSIVGFAKAVELATAAREKESERMARLRDYFWKGIEKIYPKAAVNGIAPRASAVARSLPSALPNILNVYFPGRDAQDILTRLDMQGIAASSGSACRSRALDPSHVIMALGRSHGSDFGSSSSKNRAKESVRFSFGRPTAKKEIDAALAVLKKILLR